MIKYTDLLCPLQCAQGNLIKKKYEEAGVSALKRYKDAEKSFAKRSAALFRRLWGVCSDAFARFVKAGRQKLTIMFVPHTQKKIVNIQISFFGLAGILTVFVVGMSILGWGAGNYNKVAGKLAGKTTSLQATQSDLDAMRDNMSRLVKASHAFQLTLDSTFSRIGVKQSSPAESSRTGDMSSFFANSVLSKGRVREVTEIDQIASLIEKSIKPLDELGAMLSSQGDILSEIPNLWPIKGGIGHISMYYAQNENPIYGSWYMHKGIDISTFRTGDPVLATADGKIVTVAFDIGMGNHIVIEHKYGFLTRYAHLKAFKVQKGQMVQQGQIIGYIGNTGLSTGPHLHYEVHLGTETIDPLRFLTSRTNGTTVGFSE